MGIGVVRLWSGVSRQSLQDLFRLSPSSRAPKAAPSVGGDEEEEEESLGTWPTELLGVCGQPEEVLLGVFGPVVPQNISAESMFP